MYEKEQKFEYFFLRRKQVALKSFVVPFLTNSNRDPSNLKYKQCIDPTNRTAYNNLSLFRYIFILLYSILFNIQSE